jgi:hypothetical protein
MSHPTPSPEKRGKDPSTAAATARAQAAVPSAVDRAGDNSSTKPGTEATKAAAGTNQTRRDAAQEPESEDSVLRKSTEGQNER